MKFDRQQFVSDLRGLVLRGTAYRHLGREPETGLDCVHAPAWGYRKQGLHLPDELTQAMQAYSEQPDGYAMVALMKKHFIEIPVINNSVPDAKISDLIVLYVHRNPKHVGIVTELQPLTIVEAWRSLDGKIGKLREQAVDFRQRIANCFRIPDA
jgi:hypothetical protein